MQDCGEGSEGGEREREKVVTPGELKNSKERIRETSQPRNETHRNGGGG